jgi:hypothetical protein
MAWESALKEYGTGLSSEYVNFVEGFLIPPPSKGQEYFNNIPGRLGYLSGMLNDASLAIKLDESQADLKDDKLFAEFEGGLIQQSVKGYHKAGTEPASARIQFSMQGTTIRLIRLKSYSGFPGIYSGVEGSYPGTLMIRPGCLQGAYSSPCLEDIGLLVYPISTADGQPSMDMALSSVRNYLHSEASVSWPSTSFAPGNSSHDLLLIVFNKSLSTSMEPATVFVDLNYVWDKQLEEPLQPIPSGNDTSDCTMQAISIMQNACIGGNWAHPEEADMCQNCMQKYAVENRGQTYQTFMCHCVDEYMSAHRKYP